MWRLISQREACLSRTPPALSPPLTATDFSRHDLYGDSLHQLSACPVCASTLQHTTRTQDWSLTTLSSNYGARGGGTVKSGDILQTGTTTTAWLSGRGCLNLGCSWWVKQGSVEIKKLPEVAEVTLLWEGKRWINDTTNGCCSVSCIHFYAQLTFFFCFCIKMAKGKRPMLQDGSASMHRAGRVTDRRVTVRGF